MATGTWYVKYYLVATIYGNLYKHKKEKGCWLVPGGIMQQELKQEVDVICQEFDLLHDCITLEELRWLLRRCGRFKPYWMYFLLRATTGIRPNEALHLSLYNLDEECRVITYRVDKPATKLLNSNETLKKTKHRRVVLDAWVSRQLKEYLSRACRLVDGVFVSPYHGQRLFPWKNMRVVCSFWHKKRKEMKRSGFDSERLSREFYRPKKRKCDRVYVVRPHILRHFAASVMYYKFGKDVKAVMRWIKHNNVSTTGAYVHSAESLGTSSDFLVKASWAEILGYAEDQTVIPGVVTCQTSLEMY